MAAPAFGVYQSQGFAQDHTMSLQTPSEPPHISALIVSLRRTRFARTPSVFSGLGNNSGPHGAPRRRCQAFPGGGVCGSDGGTCTRGAPLSSVGHPRPFLEGATPLHRLQCHTNRPFDGARAFGGAATRHHCSGKSKRTRRTVRSFACDVFGAIRSSARHIVATLANRRLVQAPSGRPAKVSKRY